MKPPVRARTRHRMMVLALTFNVMAPAWCVAATSHSEPGESSVPTLELLEYLGLMAESGEGELIGPDNVAEDLIESPIQRKVESGGSDRDQWISRDSPAEISERSYSSDNLFDREATDE